MTADVLSRKNIKSENAQYNKKNSAGAKHLPKLIGKSVRKKNEAELERIRNGETYYITRKSKTSPVPLSFFFLAIAVTLILMFLVLNYSQINAYTRDINKLENSIAEYKTEQARLNIEIDTKEDLRYIENTAANEYLMVKTEKADKQYVGVSGNDNIEVIKESSEGTGIGVLMSGMLKLFSDFIAG